MKKAFWIDTITYFFIFLFIYTGVAKLTEIHSLRDQLVFSPLPAPLTTFITWALPIGELLLAIALIIPALRLKALYASLILMSLFTAYVVVILSVDNHISCSCGGIIENLSPKQHVLFNSACVVLSAIAILVLRRQRPTTRFSWLTGTSVVGLFLVVAWTLFTAFSTPVRIKTGMEGSKMPAFNLLLVDSATHLNTADIPAGQPFIVIGFSPWCIHCQAETRDIIKHMPQLKNTRIYYVTNFPFRDMKAFYRYFKLAKYPNITMGRDSTDSFLSWYKAKAIPYTTIFDGKKRLATVMVGEADAGKLAQAVTE